MVQYSFPKNFWWGAAASAPQTEGFHNKQHLNVMDFWFKQSPGEFFDGVGPFTCNDFCIHYKEDIALAKAIGMNTLRTSIQWGRLIDNFETGSVNKDGLKFYDDLINTFLDNNITPIMNLFHFDMPIELFDKTKGWLGRETVEMFVKYAKTAFDLFGDRVKYWSVINEPIVQPEAGYLYGFHYPKRIGDGKDAVQIIYNLALATSKTIEVFRQSNAFKSGAKISTILNLTPTYTPTDSEADKKTREFVDDFFNNVFVESAVAGKFPQRLVEILKKDGVLWTGEPDDEKIMRDNTVDFLGVNYYHPRRVKARTSPIQPEFSRQWMPDIYFEDWVMPNCRMNPYRGWEIYPKAIYDIATNLLNKYPNLPWFISENGMGVEGEAKFINKDNMVEDDYRIDFYKEHLTWLHKAIGEGSKCFGYHAWAAWDCWSWNNAYKNRYGYIAIDLKNQKRTIKKSGYWLKETAAQNGF
jgi:6-phospho-beta-glucosidase